MEQDLKLFGELAALRMLVEAFIAASPDDTQIHTVVRFDHMRAAQLTTMMSLGEPAERIAAAKAGAIAQRRRLEAADLAPPPLQP